MKRLWLHAVDKSLLYSRLDRYMYAIQFTVRLAEENETNIFRSLCNE